MLNNQTPLLLLFGPSGAGKTTVASALAQHHGWLYYEADTFSQNAQSSPIPSHIQGMFSDVNFQTLADELHFLAKDYAGVVISFVSVVRLNQAQILLAQQYGFTVIYLFAEADVCLQSFLQREALTGRHLPAEHWLQSNETLYGLLQTPEYANYLVYTIEKGAYRPIDLIIDKIKNKLIYNAY